MKDSLLVISLVINVIICIGIPLGVFIYILVKKRNYLKSYVIFYHTDMLKIATY